MKKVIFALFSLLFLCTCTDDYMMVESVNKGEHKNLVMSTIKNHYIRGNKHLLGKELDWQHISVYFFG